MDSLTQITLGAAVGEAVLGRKIGNKAMLWGAIGGTVPDLDVLSNLVTDELSGLAFHRAFTHSFAFSFTVPILLGYLVYQLYARTDGKSWWRDFGVVLAGLIVLLFLGGAFMPIPSIEMLKISLIVSFSMVAIPAVIFLGRRLRKKGRLEPAPSIREWSWLFFWSIFTHPLLDSCTTYGTQLLQPFSDLRVGFNTISVADPIYTIPFLLLLIIAAWYSRTHQWRTYLNYAGIAVSSLYLLFTFYNKWQVNQVFEQSLAHEHLSYSRFSTTPTILNNVLWQGVAESDSVFYFGAYSLLDRVPKVDTFVPIEKNHELLQSYEQERELQILQWFSNGYYSVAEEPDGSFRLSDLRFGGITRKLGEAPDFVFQFQLVPTEDGLRYRSLPPNREMDGALELLWNRMMGGVSVGGGQ